MENNEILSQVGQMIKEHLETVQYMLDTQTETLRSYVNQRVGDQIDALKNYVDQRADTQTETLERYVDQRLDDQTRAISIIIETDITKRLDSLFDGYKLVHERQWELTRQTETLQSQMEELQLRIAALENKSA